MINVSVARRYADALYALGSEKNKTAVYGEQLKALVEVVNANKDFASLLCGKIISIQEKKQLVKNVLGELAEPDVLNFVSVVLDKNREGNLTQMLSAYDDLCDQAAGVTSIAVTTAVALDEKDVESIKTSFEGKLNKSIRIKTDVEAGLIGGIKVQIEDTIYDASIKAQLKSLRNEMMK